MTPNPNPPTIPQYTADNANTMNGNTANATPFEGDNPDRSKSNSPEGRPSPPRIYSPEADGMEVDVEDDDKQNIAQQRRGSKRAWSDDETTADQEEPLSSSEPIAKKQRTQESITQAGTSTISEQSQARENKNLRQLVKWTCEHLLEMNHGLPFKIGDIFSPNTFAQFRNALEQAIESNTPELVQKLLETGMQNCVPEALDHALILANSVGAHDVIALLNPSSSSYSSSTTALPTFFVPEKDWQTKVKLELDETDIEQITDDLADQKNLVAAYTLLFGEESANWPKGEFQAASFSFCPEKIKALLIKCGAVCTGAYQSKLVLFASDFDQAMFRSGLLNLHLEEQSLLENQNDEERKNDTFFFSADWGDLEALRSLLHNGANPAAVDDKGTSALMIASGKGHIDIMRHLLTYPIDINATDTDSQSALTWAAAHGYLSACRLLLENGARLNEEYDDEALYLAAANGHAEICELLIEQGANDDQTSEIRNSNLSNLAKEGKLDGCKILLSLGADINYFNHSGESILCSAAASGNLELVTYLWNQGVTSNGVTWATSPMIMATKKRHPEIVKFFLNQGISVDLTSGKYETALLHACKDGLVEMTTLLLEAGADVNQIDLSFQAPLVLAARCGSIEIIKQLLSFGANVFSDSNAGFKALKIAVKAGRIDIASLLLEAHTPVELIQNKKNKESLVLAAMQLGYPPTIVSMLKLLLNHGAPLHATNAKGNDALMLAVDTKNIEAVFLLQEYGAFTGQINRKGQNALHIAIDALDQSTAQLNWKMADDAHILSLLLVSAQRHPNWPQLRQEAINKAQNPITREIILQSWAWPYLDDKLTLANLARNILNRKELSNYIQFAITASPTNLSDQKITYMLSLAGICPSLIEYIRPFIQSIPQIKSQLFGNSSIIHPLIVDSFLAGMSLTLEQIRIEHGEHWKPYKNTLSESLVFDFFNQVANTEINQLIEHAANHETTNTALVFENLMETCFNSTFTAQTFPHSFPAYTAATGKLADALMAKGVYSACATKIEAAWKKAWSQFVGKIMTTDSSSSSSSSSSGSSSSMSSQAQDTVYDPDDPLGLYDDDLTSERIDELPAPMDAATYLNSSHGQELLEAFRTQLRLAVDQVGENILELPKGSTEVPAEAAKIYSDLMFRQLHMLKQFIDPDQSK